MKQKTCKNCRCKFTPAKPLQIVCGWECGKEWVIKQREKIQTAAKKAERKADREKREKLKSRREWAREAQAAVNAYIRERDKDLPCISCGRHHSGQYHAGHYLSRGAHPELAYEPLNLAKQCQPCNTHLSGNQINFRKGLIERIGIEKVEWLEGPHEPKKYSISDLKEILSLYRQRLRELQRGQV